MQPTADPAFPFRERLPVLGVPTTFASNAPEPLARVRETWGRWARLDEGSVEAATEARVWIRVGPAVGGAGGVAAYVHHAEGPRRLRIVGDAARGDSRPVDREAEVVVPADRVAAGSGFVGGLLEPATLFLLGGLDRQPLHASCVVRDGVGVLLAGPSGAGKSTLAHAARRFGFSVLADEPVYVQLRPRVRVWGRGSRLHLTVEARGRFPELGDRAPTALPSGKHKVVVEGRVDDPFFVDRVGVCLLERGPGGTTPALIPLEPGSVVEAMTAALDPGFDLYADTIGARIAAVAEGGAWTLRWGGDPSDAVALLDEAAHRCAGRP